MHVSSRTEPQPEPPRLFTIKDMTELEATMMLEAFKLAYTQWPHNCLIQNFIDKLVAVGVKA